MRALLTRVQDHEVIKVRVEDLRESQVVVVERMEVVGAGCAVSAMLVEIITVNTFNLDVGNRWITVSEVQLSVEMQDVGVRGGENVVIRQRLAELLCHAIRSAQLQDMVLLLVLR